MSKEAARWGKLLLPFVSHSAVKVRDHVLTVAESALPLMETQRKELVTGLLPVFKTVSADRLHWNTVAVCTQLNPCKDEF